MFSMLTCNSKDTPRLVVVKVEVRSPKLVRDERHRRVAQVLTKGDVSRLHALKRSNDLIAYSNQPRTDNGVIVDISSVGMEEE